MSNLSIRGANISNGNFFRTNFYNCDLSNGAVILDKLILIKQIWKILILEF